MVEVIVAILTGGNLMIKVNCLGISLAVLGITGIALPKFKWMPLLFACELQFSGQVTLLALKVLPTLIITKRAMHTIIKKEFTAVKICESTV
jgi:hypothetical protein